MDYLFPAYYVVAMFCGALVSKSLAAVIAFSVGLSLVYPNETKATFLFIFLIPAVLLSAFRD